jgi:predicted transcriptional regulator
VDDFLTANSHYFAALEKAAADPAALVAGAAELTGASARKVAVAVLQQMHQDAQYLPLDRMRKAVQEFGVNPVALAGHLGADLHRVFRRLAALPDGVLPVETGLVVCDASGSILFRKPVTGFALPRFGASCPLWPVFGALSRPMSPIRRRVSQLGRSEAQFDCMAIAWPEGQADFDRDPVFRSIMLILPVGIDGGRDAQPVGSTCRVCPRTGCPARREPSILSSKVV